MRRFFFSRPATTRSMASMKSAITTLSRSLRAASSAASFTTLARSAPTKPGVRAAISLRSTSAPSFTSREWMRRISSRPLRSGRSTSTCRSNRPGRIRAGSRISGRLVAASTISAVRASKPSISASIWFSVCSRSSWPPNMPALRLFPMASSSSMKMIAGDFAAACWNRSRTRAAPTPELGRHLEELDDLLQLLRRFVHAGDVLEGDPGVRLHVDAGLGLAEGHHARRSARHAAGHPPRQPGDEEEPDADRHDQHPDHLAHAALRDGLVLDVLVLEGLDQGVVARDANREPRQVGLRPVDPAGIAFHPVVAQDDLLAAVALDAFQQTTIRHPLESRVLEQGAQEQEADQQQEDVDQRRTEPRTGSGLLVELLAARIRLPDRHRTAPSPEWSQLPQVKA